MIDDQDLRRAFDAIGDLIVRRSADGRIVYVNAAFRRAFGGRLEDWVGRWFAVAPAAGGDAPAGRRRYDSAIDTVAGPAEIEWEESPLPDGGDFAVGRDVSARRAGEAALRDARRAAEAEAVARQSLFSSMTHELRTPLNGVLGMADLLGATPLDPEQRAYVDAIRQSGRHLLGLVEDVLDAAKLEAGVVDLADEPFDPADVLEEAVELIAVRARAKGLDLACEIDPAATLIVRGDAVRLRQIALNLLGNAVKFTEAGGAVARLTREPNADPKRAALRLSVRDTGPGVPEADRRRIFDAFAQAGTSVRRKAEGAGLGLAIVSRLAAAMDGEVRLESPASGGAEFVAELSLALDEPSATSALATPLAGLEAIVAGGPALTRSALAAQLGRLGACVIDAADAEALRIAASNAPHAVAIVGVEAARDAIDAVRALPAALVLVAPDERDELAACIAAGYAGWIIKPWRRATLIDRLRRAQAGERIAAPQAEVAKPYVERRRSTDRRRLSRSDEPTAASRRVATRSVADKRILLVEDNPVNRLLALALLKRFGLGADVAETGEAAVEMALAKPYDLILMDMRLPGLDGPEAARALRSKGVGSPIVALTANAAETDRRACLDAGMDGFLTKPIDEAAFTAALERWTKPSARANVG